MASLPAEIIPVILPIAIIVIFGLILLAIKSGGWSQVSAEEIKAEARSQEQKVEQEKLQKQAENLAVNKPYQKSLERLRTVKSLPNGKLKGAYLPGENLSNCNLEGVILEGANLNDADLTNADLTHANLKGANLNRAE
jgi:Uncharacterized low-complexity proteins